MESYDTPAVRHGVPATDISPTAQSARSSGRRLAPSDERPARDSDYSESATQVSENAVDPQRPDVPSEGPILDHAGSGSSLENTELRRTLSERHVNMMTFSAVIGIGFFLQSGRVIYLAGPGLAFIAYLLMGSVMWSVNACLGEMTALFPVTGALFELPCRFVDESIGYTVGWMSWFSWVVIIASELDAVASLFNFKFKHDYLVQNHFPNPTLEWSTNNTNPAVWVTIFLFGVVIPVNCLKVRWFGEIEYVIGVLKMLFFVGLIMFNIILNALTGTGFKYYRSPWGFTSATFKTDDGHIYTGSSAHLYGMWSAMTITIFSMIGFEMIAVSARENKDYATREGVKLATRKISLRIILLYTLGVFVVGLNVPYDDTNLVDNAIAALNNGQYSAFTIAAVRGGVTGWPNFMNAFFILSATSSGINSLYISSRMLHALAATKRVWPEWEWAERARLRLEHTHKGVPINAVFVSSAFGLLAYLAAGKSPSVALGRMALNSTVSMLIVYVVICITFLNFKKSIHHAFKGRHPQQTEIDREQNLNAYSRRNARTYPYMSHLQPLRAMYALLGCFVMAFFNGWRSFIPYSSGDFVASYISVFVFIAITIMYHIMLQGYDPRRWRLHATHDLRNPTMVEPIKPGHRRDKFHLRNKEQRFSTDNLREVMRWLWVWLM